MGSLSRGTTFIIMTVPYKGRDRVGAQDTSPSPALAIWMHSKVSPRKASVSLVLWIFPRPLCSLSQVSPTAMLYR